MRILVCCHIFYSELWEELKPCIALLPQQQTRLQITMCKDDPDLSRKILAEFPDAQIRVLENRGYDIAPFIDTVNGVNLDDFDFIVKLHTKRNIRECFCHVNYRWIYGKRWRRMLLKFISSPTAVNQTLALFREDPTIGMVGNGDCWIDYERYNMPYDSTFIAPELKRLGIKTQERGFLSGTMFICRAEIFKPLQHKIAFTDFPAVADHRTNLSHAYEMMFGVLVYENKLRFSDYRSRPLGLPRMLFLRKLFFRILYRCKSYL
ncbi:MAG: rhamnan synthesis F family protein [Victivallales bacterium]|jgi:lipopolysaccharide biosynthesis protein|nr:rhamnan synthesis F family protein [Victivallales bacterium]